MGSGQSFSKVYNVQRIILLVFYGISVVALAVLLFLLFHRLSQDSLFPLVVGIVLYLLLAVVFGSFIHTLSYIPFHLAAAFDPIKNDIAMGEIRTVRKLGERITAFTVEFFDFTFLDIDHAFLQTEFEGPFSHEELSGTREAMEEFGMLEKSRALGEISRAGQLQLEGRAYHLYILPIRFGDKWLGYMGILTRRRLGKLARQFLSDFENQFLDDQLMLVMTLD